MEVRANTIALLQIGRQEFPAPKKEGEGLYGAHAVLSLKEKSELVLWGLWYGWGTYVVFCIFGWLGFVAPWKWDSMPTWQWVWTICGLGFTAFLAWSIRAVSQDD